MARSISIPLWIIIICLGLIVASFLLVQIWPIVERGSFDIHIMEADVAFDVTPFFISVALFLGFIIMVIKIVRNRSSKLMTVLFTVLLGVGFIISLSYQSLSFAWTPYPPLSSLQELDQRIFQFIRTAFIILSVIAGIAICLVVYIWYRRRKKNLSHH